MGFAVELGFDPITTANVGALWQQFADADISSFMLDVQAEPHVSLAVFDEVDTVAAGEVVQDFASRCGPLELTFGAVGTFPTDEGVVYLAPVVTRQLLDVHAQFHALLVKRGLRSHSYYSPGHWTPHCTIAMELAVHIVGEAVLLCRNADLFRKGMIVSVNLIKFRPVTYLSRQSLGG